MAAVTLVVSTHITLRNYAHANQTSSNVLSQKTISGVLLQRKNAMESTTVVILLKRIPTNAAVIHSPHILKKTASVTVKPSGNVVLVSVYLYSRDAME